MKHPGRELPREGILLARVVRGEQGQILFQQNRSPMAELGARLGDGAARFFVRFQKRIEGDLPQRHHDAHAAEKPELLNQIRTATVELDPGGLVGRRRAADRGGDIAIPKSEPVVTMNRGGLVGKPKTVKGLIKPIAAAIAREESSGAIPSMRRRGQTDDKESRLRAAESGKRPRPVRRPLVSTRRAFSCLFSPTHQARALPAFDDGLVETRKLIHRTFLLPQSNKKRNRDAASAPPTGEILKDDPPDRELNSPYWIGPERAPRLAVNIVPAPIRQP